MTEFWLGILVGAVGISSLVALTVIAIRVAEHSGPMAGGHWDADDELRHLLDQDAGR